MRPHNPLSGKLRLLETIKIMISNSDEKNLTDGFTRCQTEGLEKKEQFQIPNSRFQMEKIRTWIKICFFESVKSSLSPVRHAGYVTHLRRRAAEKTSLPHLNS
jgi:hypothetical protein